MTTGAILVTGGAGYIGSHAVRQFLAAGYRVVVLDNLSTGFRWAVAPDAAFVEGDAGDALLVGRLIEEHGVGAVVHFAGSLVVPESVERPLKYYGNNTAVSRNLIEACVEKGIERFVFSSTAAVYGTPEKQPVAEATEPRPINPYGRSKLVTEWILRDVAASAAGQKLRHVILRYFNVAGASVDGTLGQATRDATHLIKVACEAACGTREKVVVFGTDYPRRRTGPAFGTTSTSRISLARTWMRFATWRRAVRRIPSTAATGAATACATCWRWWRRYRERS